jgi:hypothetical protein
LGCADRLDIVSLRERWFLRVSQSPPPSRLRILSQCDSRTPSTNPMCSSYCELLHKYFGRASMSLRQSSAIMPNSARPANTMGRFGRPTLAGRNR